MWNKNYIHDYTGVCRVQYGKKFLSLEKFYTNIVSGVSDYYQVCAECALTQSARFFLALWVKAHSAQGGAGPGRPGRGVNRKHHPAERSDLRFGFQSARKIFQSARKN